MRPIPCLLFTATTLLTTNWSLSSAVEFWECIAPDGSSLYTNRERQGCRALKPKPLSSAEDQVVVSHQPKIAEGPFERLDRATQAERYVRELFPPTGQEEICGKFLEWVHLNEKTQGGLYFQTFADNVRYVALQKIFAAGYMPTGCP